jgi:folate-dependent phosphoribosylglycinamide formyltransferase PurN
LTGRDVTGARRAIVMLAGRGESTNIVYHSLAKSFEIEKVILEDSVPRTEFIRRRVRKLGLARVAGQVLFRSLVVPGLRMTSRRRIREIHEHHGMDPSPIEEMTLARVRSVNAEATIRLLKELEPALIVVNGTRIISSAVLHGVLAPFINIHAGITPQYRGVHGGYWALARNDPRACGVSVHLVDEGIDTGPILGQATISPTTEDNFVTYPHLQLAAAMPVLSQAIRDQLAARVKVLPASPGPSRAWSHPTIREYFWNRLRRGVK